VLGSSISLLAISVHSLFDFNLYIPANGILAVVLAGILVSHLRFSTERYWWKSCWQNRIIAGLVVVGMTGLLVFPMSGRYLETKWLQKAKAAEPFSSNHIEALAESVRVEPGNFETSYRIGDLLSQLGHRFVPGSGYEQQLEVAIQWFEKSLQAWPDCPYAYAEIGRCQDALGREDEATPYFDRAFALDPRNIIIVNHMGFHELERGDLEAAHDYFQMSWNLRYYGNLDAMKNLIILKKRLGKPPLTDPITGDPYYSDIR
jgi:tetratricopeptide (TPR) repeat protein